MSTQKPIHFLVGTGRCGSTLVHEVLCHHRDVAFVSNLDDRLGGAVALAGANGAVHRALPRAASRKGRPRFGPSEAYRALDREVSPVLAWARRDLVAQDATPWLAGRLRTFFAARAERQRAGTFVHKFTGWPRVGLLREVFPQARFVHVVRDGRAVANSWVKEPWWKGHEGPDAWQWGPLDAEQQAVWDEGGRSYPLLAGLGWARLVEAWERQRDALPEDAWLELRYEDVLADPVGRFAELTSFLGLADDPDFAAHVAAQPMHLGRVDAWRDDLGPSEAKLLGAALRPQLERLGYPVDAA